MVLTVEEVIKRRHEIAINYATEKGWLLDINKPVWEQLSFEQILEIRQQQNWIDAGKSDTSVAD